MSAATAAFTTDPRFMAALVAAIRPIVKGGANAVAQAAESPVTVSSDTKLGRAVHGQN